ncbi:hypothetical protein ACJX0J_038830, partial [Zea mays]
GLDASELLIQIDLNDMLSEATAENFAKLIDPANLFTARCSVIHISSIDMLLLIKRMSEITTADWGSPSQAAYIQPRLVNLLEREDHEAQRTSTNDPLAIQIEQEK